MDLFFGILEMSFALCNTKFLVSPDLSIFPHISFSFLATDSFFPLSNEKGGKEHFICTNLQVQLRPSHREHHVRQPWNAHPYTFITHLTHHMSYASPPVPHTELGGRDTPYVCTRWAPLSLIFSAQWRKETPLQTFRSEEIVRTHFEPGFCCLRVQIHIINKINTSVNTWLVFIGARLD